MPSTSDNKPARSRRVTPVRGATLRKLDAEGGPVGEPVRLPVGEVSMDVEPDDRPEQGLADAVEGAEKLQVAPVLAGNMEFSTSDPAAVALVRELTRIPIPTAVINEWFPTYVRVLPDQPPWINCRTFLTPQGLYVYRTAPDQPETFTTGATPAWYSPVDFAETAKPVTGYAAMNAGIPITTAAGKVTVQPTSGCGCNARRLKNWTPRWARNRISWGDAVAISNSTAGR